MRPSALENATTFAPPPSTTDSLSFSLRTAVGACWAARNNGDAHKVSAPVIAPCRISLRSTIYSLLHPKKSIDSHLRNHAGAVTEFVALHSNLLKHREVEIRDRGALRQHDVLAAEFQFAVAATD